MSSKEQKHSNEPGSAKKRSPKSATGNLNVAQQQPHLTTLIQRAKLDPRSLTPGEVLQLQRLIGNQDVGQLMAAKAQHQPIQQDESTDLGSAINSARGGGQPLDAGLQRSMGQAKGTHQPGSQGGQALIADELTHVVQQMPRPLHYAHRQTESPARERISPKPSVLQRANVKPKRPNNVAGKEKNALEKAVRENNNGKFVTLAKAIYAKAPAYYMNLRKYKLKKHENTPAKRVFWAGYNPESAPTGFSVSPQQLRGAMSRQAPPKPKVQKQGIDNQCGPSSMVNILHLLGKKGVTLEDLQDKVALKILAKDPNFQQTATLNGIQVDRRQAIRKQLGTIGEGMVMSAYYAGEIPAVLELYGVKSAHHYLGSANQLVQTMETASKTAPVILLHNGHYTLCVEAKPWTANPNPTLEPWWDESAKLNFWDSWPGSPDQEEGELFRKSGTGITLWYKSGYIFGAWVIKVS